MEIIPYKIYGWYEWSSWISIWIKVNSELYCRLSVDKRTEREGYAEFFTKKFKGGSPRDDKTMIGHKRLSYDGISRDKNVFLSETFDLIKNFKTDKNAITYWRYTGDRYSK